MGNNFQKRLREYSKPQDAVSGFASSKSDLNYWAKRASENSYHSKGDGPRTKQPGTSDKNHTGGTFEPNVRRGPT